MSEDLEEAKPRAAAALPKQARTALHRGKTQEPRRKPWIGRHLQVEHAADPSTKTNRGGLPRNGRWGARDGDVTLTRPQEQSCEGHKTPGALPQRRALWQGYAKPVAVGLRRRSRRIRRRMAATGSAAVSVAKKTARMQQGGRRTHGGVERKTARAHERRSGIDRAWHARISAVWPHVLKG